LTHARCARGRDHALHMSLSRRCRHLLSTIARRTSGNQRVWKAGPHDILAVARTSSAARASFSAAPSAPAEPPCAGCPGRPGPPSLLCCCFSASSWPSRSAIRASMAALFSRFRSLNSARNVVVSDPCQGLHSVYQVDILTMRQLSGQTIPEMTFKQWSFAAWKENTE
jgi:hypothetical protein